LPGKGDDGRAIGGKGMKYWKAVYKTNKHGVYATGGIGGSSYTEFKVGETYEVNGEPELCKNGFHFYRAKDFIFGIDLFSDRTCFVEIEPLTQVVNDTEKCVATKIKILKYIPKKQWKKQILKNSNSGNMNSGYRNSGDMNSGNWNSGNWNSGNWNSGNMNSGDSNSGNWNSGNWNSGDMNSGDWNSGDWNSGNGNSGNRNSGDWNSGNGNSGNGYRNYFCTKTRFFLFDIEVTENTIDKFKYVDMSWFNLKDKTYKEAWKECPKDLLNFFASIKQFRTKEARKKFKQITGLELPK
jgi:hypothetical protein